MIHPIHKGLLISASIGLIGGIVLVVTLMALISCI